MCVDDITLHGHIPTEKYACVQRFFCSVKKIPDAAPHSDIVRESTPNAACMYLMVILIKHTVCEHEDSYVTPAWFLSPSST